MSPTGDLLVTTIFMVGGCSPELAQAAPTRCLGMAHRPRAAHPLLGDDGSHGNRSSLVLLVANLNAPHVYGQLSMGRASNCIIVRLPHPSPLRRSPQGRANPSRQHTATADTCACAHTRNAREDHCYAHTKEPGPLLRSRQIRKEPSQSK